jgi:hypothetical protein
MLPSRERDNLHLMLVASCWCTKLTPQTCRNSVRLVLVASFSRLLSVRIEMMHYASRLM